MRISAVEMTDRRERAWAFRFEVEASGSALSSSSESVSGSTASCSATVFASEATVILDSSFFKAFSSSFCEYSEHRK